MAKGIHRQARLRELVQQIRELAALERAAKAAIDRFRIDYDEKIKAVRRATDRYEKISDDVQVFDFEDAFDDLVYVDKLEHDAAAWTKAADELAEAH